MACSRLWPSSIRGLAPSVSGKGPHREGVSRNSERETLRCEGERGMPCFGRAFFGGLGWEGPWGRRGGATCCTFRFHFGLTDGCTDWRRKRGEGEGKGQQQRERARLKSTPSHVSRKRADPCVAVCASSPTSMPSSLAASATPRVYIEEGNAPSRALQRVCPLCDPVIARRVSCGCFSLASARDRGRDNLE